MIDSEVHVSISNGNSKMGSVRSVSLPPVVTCNPKACAVCGKKCYALKICRLRKTVRDAYNRNLQILETDGEKYWREVAAQMAFSRFFRFHVSGDIPNREYLENMTKAARMTPDTQIICFTKQYDICNEYLGEKKRLPKNLHLIFSGWKGLEMNNPHNLPEAHVLFKNGDTTARDGAKLCTGNCFECAVEGRNCWNLKKGEQIVLREH